MRYLKGCAAAAAAVVCGGAAAQAPDEATLALGREVFTEIAEPRCPICHMLADAGAEGTVGPSLDAMRPEADRVKAAVTLGIGPMRPYDELSEAEIEALAQYVAAVAGT
jgi:cytochrome c6